MAAEKQTKKQKKSSEFRTKKRKLDDSIPDVPEEDTGDKADEKDESSAKRTKVTKEAKDTKDTKETKDSKDTSEDGKKKRRRGKGAAKDEAKDATETKEGAAEESKEVKAVPKNQKFIVFVGNLPFNITKEVLEKHFESCGKITSVRVQTDKVTGKGKGFAFMEFPEAEAMQKALYFNKTLIKERPINVELTAGGGGNKSAARKKKIADKNEALNEERRKVHEKHIAPAKEAKSSYAAANPPVVQKKAVKAIKKPSEISGANAVSVEGLSSRLRRA
ncbi:hypothetical protein BGZ70_005105 [Mortierella alpina]|uniref:RRM domain-containing protein n=1 Tax=Mortierella alpina TaxID=64518 RepID=A0A9P6IQF1_MORAP|nr:hypothetical protein BGZ70_005105 [Mortierella alpina]